LLELLEKKTKQVSKGFGKPRCLFTLMQIFGEKVNKEENVITSTTLNPSHRDVTSLAAQSIVP
jgi:hypothetical protein